MENTKHILKSIDNIYTKAKASGLKDSYFNDIKTDLEQLSNYLKISKRQAFIYANIFTLNYMGDSVDFSDLVKYFDCSPIKLLEYSKDFDSLEENSFISKFKSSHRGKLERSNYQYVINEKITEAILNNESLPKLNSFLKEDAIELLESLYELGKQREDDEISTFRFRFEIRKLLKLHHHFSIVKKTNALHLNTIDQFIFLYLIWKLINGTELVYVDKTAEILEKPKERMNLIQSIIKETNALSKLKLIEIEAAKFVDDTQMRLSKKAINLAKESGIELFISEQKRDDIIEPQGIASKKLFYNSEEDKQIQMLTNLLKKRKFLEVQTRLKQKKLPKGVAVLLYGSPGTGKTESVYQIARKTGRKIMQVDISQSKSMWFGESEKVVKKIFTDYREFSQECKTPPILLFNEADAILSKRKDSSSSNVAQTENAIQNIILQELERFDGIFLATTNMVNNLDTAFERRFLFKIEFFKPEFNVMQKIWKSKLKGLSKEQYQELTSQFDFSGGQIDNIVRKVDLYDILHGKNPNFKEILEYCKVEQIAKQNRKTIGFVA